MQVINSLEGGTHGTAISAANSGGASGDAFNSITNSPVPVFSSDQSRDAISIEMVDVAGTTGVNWTWASSTVNHYFRTYLYLAALPSGNDLKFLRVMSDTAGARCAEFSIKRTGTAAPGVIGSQNAAAGTAAPDGTVAITTGQWVRFECRVLPSVTVGEVEWRLYNTADSSTITDTSSAGSLVLAADIEGARFGSMATAPTTPFTVYFDDLAANDTGWLGPSSVQTLLPDADTATGGWTTAPLFSKVNDSSDATFITATAS